jgi:hypothetical protein
MFYFRTITKQKEEKSEPVNPTKSDELYFLSQKYGRIEEFTHFHEKPEPTLFSTKDQDVKSEIENNPKEAKKSMGERFDKICKEFVAWSVLTKFDGFSKIFHTNHSLLKFVWLSLFLAFSVLTAYFVTKNFLDYFSFETVSKIEIKNEQPTQFIAVTICNANTFTTTKAQQLISNIAVSNYGRHVNEFTSEEILQNFSHVIDMTRMFVSQKSYGDTNIKLLGNAIGIQDCKFNNEPCSKSDFTWYYSYVYGNCWQFNANASISHMTTIEGQLNGLSLSLTVPKNTNTYPHLEGQGLKLYIHNKSFVPRTADLISVKPGLCTNVAVEKTIIYKTAYPYSECRDLVGFTSTYQRALEAANKPYKQYECFRICLQHLINEHCGCYWSRYTNLDSSLQPCLNLTQLHCIREQQKEFKITEECLEQCPLECETVTYDAQTTLLDYPSSTLYDYLLNNTEYVQSFRASTGKNFSMETASSHLVSLNIFFASFEYKIISLEPKLRIFELVSQIGGSMGMLVGFSMFHLVELVEIILLILFTLLKK